MSHYTAILSESVGLDPEMVKMMQTASKMHDLGKIGISDSILLKPGKLTPEEFEIMKTHTLLGAEILSKSNSPLVQLAEKIALSHHEKWNGTGYPNQLSGEQIPLEARIVAIADVFDALTSERPYKKAWSLESAIEFFKTEKGKHFDPQLVDLFFDRLPDILAIKNQFQESYFHH